MSNLTDFPNINLIEEQACDWIVKLEGDDPPSAQVIAEFNAWMKQSPKHKSVLLSMTETWGEMEVLSGLSIAPVRPSKRSELRRKIYLPLVMLAALIAGVGSKFVNLLTTVSRPVVGIPVLAMLFTIGLSTWYLIDQPITQNNVYLTNLGEHSEHTLDDGSVLWLNSNSQVEVNYSSSKRKISLLKGEAHFDVVPDAERPFEVYAGNRMVKAVGTAFSVYRLDDRIEVMVTEGKVDLAIMQDTLILSPESHLVNTDKAKQQKLDSADVVNEPKVREVLTSLTAGQSVSIPLVSDKIVEPIINHERGELARKLSWLEGRLVFAGESLDEVVQEVSRHTPIKIEVADPQLKSLRIGGQFQAGETDALFDVLESGFGIKITRVSKGHVQLHAQ
jgi:transmembrane sensor